MSLLHRIPRNDVLIALVAVVALQVDFWFIEGVSGDQTATVVSALVFGGSLLLRRAQPLLMIGLASLALVAGAAAGGTLTETLTLAATAMVVVFSAGLYLPRRESFAAVAVFLLATWADLVLARDAEYSLVSDIAFTSMIIVPGPFLAGRALRDRRKRTDELERLTEQLREERDNRARVAVLDERARIAREMHDVVAHSVSLMVVQTGAARHLLDEDREQSRSALYAVEDAGRQALQELRRALGILRGGMEPVALTPQPGLGELDALLERTRTSGLPVELTQTGEPQPLAPGVDLTVFRIVQEALTNTLKHAGPATAQVTLDWQPRALTVEISDDGRGPDGRPASPDSHGLVGMRERVAVYGGTVETGARDATGFTVRARIPLEPQREQAAAPA